MDVYIARQAILNRRENISAYELFFRDGPDNFFPKHVDANIATSKVIDRTHFNKGIRPVTSGKRALINFSEESLINRLPLLLPPGDVIIEILETVRPNELVLEACREMRRKGYVFALDDFIYKKEWKPFLKLATIVKFDIMQTPLDTIGHLVSTLKKHSNLRLLAEKIETKVEYQLARKMGFHFFQGYYFCKPEMQKSKNINANQYILMMLYKEVVRPEMNYKKITSLLEKDTSLTYKLLCYVNSGGFPLKTTITSVKQALTYLGDEQLRKLLLLFVTAILSENKPQELTNLCVVRAKYCQLVANTIAPELSEQGFLTGLFSLLDAVLDVPMYQALERLPVPDEIIETLIDEEDKSQTPLSMTLRSIKLIEQNKWYLSEREAMKMRISTMELNKFYKEAVSWADCYKEDNLKKHEVFAT